LRIDTGAFSNRESEHCDRLGAAGNASGLNSQETISNDRPHTQARGDVTMNTAKQDVELLLNKLPDDCSVEDIQYHLYVLDKVRRGLEDARLNGTLSHEEVESRLSKWLAD
jgi:hypothetical protein